MKILLTSLFILTLAPGAFTQNSARDQKMSRIKALSAELDKLASELLLPDPADVSDAATYGAKAFRIMPREIFERKLPSPQGGGSYYSFTTGSHDYQKIAQIGLEQDFILSGFAGGDYGLLADLGRTELKSISLLSPEAAALAEHTPKMYTRGYQSGAFNFVARVPAIVGNSYLLRAVDFDRADVTVALKIVRKDSDGSLIVYWKPLVMRDKVTSAPADAK